MHKLKNAEQLARSVEKYLLTDKQDKSLLNDFIPGSKEDIYFRCIEALHSDKKYSDLDDELKHILEPQFFPDLTSNYRPDVLRRKLLLRKFDETQDFQTIGEELENYHSLYPESAKAPAFLRQMGIKGLGEGPKDPSVFNPTIDFDLKEGLRGRYIYQIHPIFRHEIDFTKGDPGPWLLTGQDLIDYDNDSFYKALKKTIKDGNASSIKFKNFNIAQLERLMSENKSMRNNPEAIGMLFTKTFQQKGSIPGIEEGRFSIHELRHRLKEMLKFLDNYPNSMTQGLRAVILYELLHNGVQSEIFEYSVLKSYLKNPLRSKHSETIVNKRYVSSSSGASSLQAAMKAVQAPDSHKTSDTEMLKAFINYFLKHPEEIVEDGEEGKRGEDSEAAEEESKNVKIRQKVLDDDNEEPQLQEDLEMNIQQQEMMDAPQELEYLEQKEEALEEDYNDNDQDDQDDESDVSKVNSDSYKSDDIQSKVNEEEKEQPLGGLTKYFKREFLKQTIKQIRFMDGVKVEMSEREYSHYEWLGRKIILQFLPSNQDHFKPEEVVRMKLAIKNVPELLLRVFEINTQNYYREKNEAFRSDINLEGLVPAQERVFTFDQAPHLLHNQQFEISELTNKVGLFVIEFIGNGMSSRAIVKKGSLTLVSRATLAGHVVYIVDGNKKICKSNNETGLFFDNRFFKADPKTGRIVVPYSASSLQAKAVISHKGFSSICEFERFEEKYQLQAAFIVHEEAFIIGNKAKVLIRPELTLHGRQVPLSLLKKISVSVELHTGGESEGVNTSKFENLELKDDELTVEIQIPAKLHNLAIQLQGQVSGKEKSHKVDVGFLRNIELFQNNFHYVEGYLRFTKQEEYELLILGKNGEPVKNQKLGINWKHRYYNQEQGGRYQTDNDGIVEMGPLYNIEWIGIDISAAAGRDYVSRQWVLPKTLYFKRQKSIQILQHQLCRIPVQSKELEDNMFSLTRVNQNREPLRDCSSNLEFEAGEGLNYLIIKSLKPGSYILHVKEEKVKIKIEIVEGSVWQDDDFLVTESAIVDRACNSQTLVISEIDVNENEVTCSVANMSAKTSVHVLGFSFIPQNLSKLFQSLEGLKLTQQIDEFSFLKWSNFYLGQKLLSNQFRYVLERNRLPTGTGNMLEKPTLLLKRQEIRNTNFEKPQLESGEALDIKREILQDKKKKKKKRERKPRFIEQDECEEEAEDDYFYNQKECNFKDDFEEGEELSIGRLYESNNVNFLQQFLANPAIQIFGSAPDEHGKVRIQAPGIQKFSTLVVLAVNNSQMAQAVHPLSKTGEEKRNLSLQKPMNVEKGFTEVRHSQPLKKHQTYTIEDIASTELSLIDSLQSATHALKDIAKINSNSTSTLEDHFGWLKKWSTLKPQEKLNKFASYACHELNVYLKFKDKAFFEGIVIPYLLNKMEKTFIDHYLLDNQKEMEKYYTTQYRRNQLNPLELTLLAISMARRGEKLKAQAIADLLRREEGKFSISERNQCFDTVLKLYELKQNDEFKDLIDEEKKLAKDELSASGAMSEPDSGSDDSDDSDLSERDNDIATSLRGRYMVSDEAFYENEEKEYKPRKKAKGKSKKYNSEFYREKQLDLLALRGQEQSYLEQMGATKEFAETHYYNEKCPPGEATAYKVSYHSFWAAVAEYAVLHEGSLKNFSNSSFIYHAGENFTAQAAILSFLYLPEKASSHGLRPNQSRGLEINAANNLIVFLKEVRETESKEENQIIVVQRYYEGNDSSAKNEVNQFLVSRPYGCQVIMTNVSAESQDFSVLVEIPQGSLPLNETQYRVSLPYTLEPFSTKKFSIFFYFPSPGSFIHFPANVSKVQTVVAKAKVRKLKVVQNREVRELVTFADILASGNKTTILEFLRQKNLTHNELGFQFSHIHYLMKEDETFWRECMKIFRNRLIFDQVTWSYGIKYKDLETVKELVNCLSDLREDCGSFFESKLVSVGNEGEGKRWVDFYPLVNARAHRVGNDLKSTMTNREQRAAYMEFIYSLLEKKNISDLDRFKFVVYLLLQDRNLEAYTLFKKIEREEFAKKYEAIYEAEGKKQKMSILTVQLDYLSAYFDFLFGEEQNFKVAREMVKRYAHFPIAQWRLLFFDVAEQLREYDGEYEEEEELKEARTGKTEEERKREAKRKAIKSEITLHATLEGTDVKVESSNLDQVTLKFYFVDLEVLFSRQPFLTSTSNMREFSFVQPGLVTSHHIQKQENAELSLSRLQVPKELQSKNFVVEVSSADKREFLTYFSTSLKVGVVESYGELKVTNDQAKPLPGVYVKVFVRLSGSSQSQFYKDGYTDIRGKFDYAQFSGSSLPQVDRFALLVTHEKYGSLTLEAGTPAGATGGKTKEVATGQMMSMTKAKRYMKKKEWAVQELKF